MLAARLQLVILGLAAIGVICLTACSQKKAPARGAVRPTALARLALDVNDVNDAYSITVERYVNDDGTPVPAPSHEFERRLSASPGSVRTKDAPATGILVTIGDRSADEASDFLAAAEDDQVGPANLEDDVRSQTPGARDVHAELLQDFETLDDQSVAFKITWRQGTDTTRVEWHAYRVYVRSGGLLALVALRAPADASGGEP
jgi:hypothetical protein